MSSLFVPLKFDTLSWHEGRPYSVLHGSCYYPPGDGLLLLEKEHHFIRRAWANFDKQSAVFNVASFGFGFGLSFLHTWSLWDQVAPSNACLCFIAIEEHPLKLQDVMKCLTLWPEGLEKAKQLIEQYPILTPGYHHLSFCNGRVRLSLILGDTYDGLEQLLICKEPVLESRLRSAWIDAWYLGTLSTKPYESKIEPKFFEMMAMLSRNGAAALTPLQSDEVLAQLASVGFCIDEIETRPQIAFYKNPLTNSLIKPHTPWQSSPPGWVNNQRAIIIGAGLAGCFMAYALAVRGWDVTLFEAADEVATGGSGNQKAVLFPKFSAHKSPFAEFMLNAFIYAHGFYKKFLAHTEIAQLSGALLLAYNEKERQAQGRLREWLAHYPELGALVDGSLASDFSGIDLEEGGLFTSLSGWINSPALCHLLIAHHRISKVTHSKVESISFHQDKWVVQGVEAPVVILANGAQINTYAQTHSIPIEPVSGQMSMIQANVLSQKTRIPLCAKGHVLPDDGRGHFVGATYHRGQQEALICRADDEANGDTFKKIMKTDACPNKVIGQWAGVRATTSDYFPLVGPIPNRDRFIEQFKPLAIDSNRWIAAPGAYYPGLYAFAGFGSRGLTTIPLCSQWLAGLIHHEISVLPRGMIMAISPARFLRKEIIKGVS